MSQPQSFTKERREASITDLKLDLFKFVVLYFAMRKAVASNSSGNLSEYTTFFTKLVREVNSVLNRKPGIDRLACGLPTL